MKNVKRILPYLFLLALMAGATAAFCEDDVAGCQDHPLLTRMPNFFINNCSESDFDRFEFSSDNGAIPVEGKRTSISYFLKEGSKAPSILAIIRNYTNAMTKIGGEVVYDSAYRATIKLIRGPQEIWLGVDVVAPYQYLLEIVEKSDMQQQVMASAEGMTSDITTLGHTALYGIYFDTGKSDLKPESGAALNEIARMLKQNSALKIWVVGHTDNVGALPGNIALSLARAESVVNELTTGLGVDPEQLAAQGVGPLSPVSSNAEEEGRALNRRVELVAQ